MSELKNRVLRAGSHLILRQVLSMAIALGGMTTLARLIGPSNYGVFVTASTTAFYIYILFEFGIVTQLARLGPDDAPPMERQAFSLLLCLSFICTVLMITATIACADFIVPNQWIMVPFIIGVPLQLMQVVPLARLERELRYRIVARIEVTVQIVFYSVALPYSLFYNQSSAWGPSLGWLVQQVVSTSLLYWFSRVPIGLTWNSHLVRQLLVSGVGLAGSGWIWHLRRLVNPWIVGAIAGAEVVGIIALAMRFVEALTFVQASIWRMSVPVMGRICDDKDRLLSMINETLQLLVPVVGLCLLTFSLLGRTVIDWLIGPRWDEMFVIVPFLSISALANCMVALHSSALYVLKRSVDVIYVFALSVVLLAVGTLIFVPRFGIIGYGFAELFAIPSYVLFHFLLNRQLSGRRLHYGLLLYWAFVFSAGMFSWPIGAMAVLLVVCYPKFWRAIAANVRTMFR